MPAWAQCRETRPMDQGSPAPRPPGMEKEYCLTMMSRPFPGSTQSQETINTTASKPQHQMWPLIVPPSPQSSQLLKQTGPSSNPNFWFVWPKSAAATSNRGRNPTREELNSKRVFDCPFRSWHGKTGMVCESGGGE